MANKKQAVKRAKQSEKARQNNRWQKTRMSTHIKRVLLAIDSKDVAASQAEYREAVSILDRLACKGIIGKNKAARHKSRLNKRIKGIAAA